MKKRIVAAATGAVLALGVGVGVNQAMADPSASPTASSSASSDSSTKADPGSHEGRGKHGDRGGKGGEMGKDLTTLADKLGVDEATLRTAVSQARDSLPKPTKDDSQTAEQREAARAERDAAFAKALAANLNVDESKVTTALNEIKAERDAERAAGLKSQLDTAVQAGTLTQAEADAVTKAVKLGVIGGGR